MSNFAQSNGDDYPDAAGKHLEDAKVLLSQHRPDGTTYLCGYVAECSLKSVLQLDGHLKHGHKLSVLLSETLNCALATAGSKTARYITPYLRVLMSKPIIAAWKPEMRYQSPRMTPSDASNWFQDAEQLYKDTIARLILDGEIR